ncbi:hypothetical protein ACIA8M_15840 [Streptomyces anulatus]|uniref:hypothetical protein n=1 Tax=Streptomyces anulatus TaxID=1892 RepID=UPI00379B18ED|nr:hypothetical protein OHA54_21535 [Streptomyces anulatus]WTE04965.1 hypothetical protein OH765_21635 [Streptomyces anulatus]
MKKLAHAMASGAAALGLLAGAQGVAQAEAQADDVRAVPSCVKSDWTLMGGIIVTITNECSTTQQVNVRYSFNGEPFIPDKCHTIAPGKSVSTSEPMWSASRFEGLIPC